MDKPNPISIQLEQEQLDGLRRLAVQRGGCSLASLIREAVDRLLQREAA